MEYLLITIGVVIGSLITNILYLIKRANGILQIDHSNPEKDVYRFKIDNLDSINNKSHIVLTIDHNADLSQK